MNKKVVTFVGIGIAIVSICLIAFLFQNNDSNKTSWQEQYDLGVRYLSEGNYEEAIIAFTAAIEIEPKQADAYVQLANLYIGFGDIADATDILHKALEHCNDITSVADLLAQLESGKFSYNLTLTDVRFEYDAESEVKYLDGNDGAIGGVSAEFTVVEPDDVAYADIEAISDLMWLEDTIKDMLEFGRGVSPVAETSYWGIEMPIYDDISEMSQYIVVVAFDSNRDFVGYSVIGNVGICNEVVSAMGDDNLDFIKNNKSLLEQNATTNIISIEDLTFCGYQVSSMDFNALTAVDYISMMKNEGFSEGTENVDVAESWTVRRWQDYEQKYGKYTGFGDASVSVEFDVNAIDLRIDCSRTYYGEKQLSIGIKDICIGSSFEEVLSNLGFENSAEISEKLHEIFSETKSIGDDDVEDALNAMLQYNGDNFRTGNVRVEPDNWELTLFVDDVENADFYTLTFHFGADGAAIDIYDDSIGKYRNWTEYRDCLTWFEITVFK